MKAKAFSNIDSNSRNLVQKERFALQHSKWGLLDGESRDTIHGEIEGKVEKKTARKLNETGQMDRGKAIRDIRGKRICLKRRFGQEKGKEQEKGKGQKKGKEQEKGKGQEKVKGQEKGKGKEKGKNK
jgi:hypothetical protein